jgi:Skp family chaperone for outer membrane proteins
MKSCFQILGLLCFLFLSACQGEGGGQSVQNAVTLDISKLMNSSPDIKQLLVQEEASLKIISELNEKGKALKDEMDRELAAIPDSNSLAFRNKQSHYRRRLDELRQKMFEARFSYAQQASRNYDKAYRQVMQAALRVARRHQASLVLPLGPLPNPVLDRKRREDPVSQLDRYRIALRSRQLVAASASLDITGEVFKELQWKP